MRRNCNLELTLFPSYDSGHHHHIMEEASQISPQQQQQQQQKLTIFYDGKICVSDVTELQARSILMAANKEMEERVKTPKSATSETSSGQMYSPTPALSMKRSLQRFLQKRKTRIQEASPYHQ